MGVVLEFGTDAAKMKKLLLSVVLELLSVHVGAQETLPKDVERFIEKREGCDHFRGEIPDPEQKPRMREVNREMTRFCSGTDMALFGLKRKYAKDDVVMERLGEFEPHIEAANVKQAKERAGAHR
jgi:hypothetical protein